MNKIKLLLIAVIITVTNIAVGQVTTSSMSGKVTDAGGPLAGAAIKATHTPTGTVYVAVTDGNGKYNIPNLRIGGPYTIEFSFMGFHTETIKDVQLSLGEEFNASSVLRENSNILDEVVVTGERNSVISGSRTGAQEIITKEKMEKLPTINRSLNDYTRLTPMSSGNNFAGTSYRFNNVTVDGASFNNSFGLGSGSLGASGTEPISLEALEQVQVMIAPYDVRNGAFTGAGINSVTKSGSNQFHASAYMYTKSPDLTGWRQKEETNNIVNFTNKQYGVSISGPILKNKIFFYLNGELDRQEEPVNFRPRKAGQQTGGQYSIPDEKTLQELSDFLQQKFDYNPGSYNVTTRPTQADRLTARIDWNISSKHILSLKYFYLKSFNTSSPSTSGMDGGRGPNEYSIPFSSTYYRSNSNFNIIMADLSSTFSSKVSNTLKVGYSALRDYREMDGGFFPQVDIMSGTRAYTTFGTEANSYNNMLNTDIWQIQDNLLINLDKHQITIGTQSDLRKFKNGYAYSFAGAWRYKSIDDFYKDANNYLDWKNKGSDPASRPPTVSETSRFSQAYSKKGDFPFVSVDVLTLGFYVQDKWAVTPNLNVTLGLRMDMPIFLNKLEENTVAESITFQGGKKIDVSKFPNPKPLFSPRLGFNWDVMGNKTLQVRGGTGLFSGTPPYVWLSNQAGNNGMLFGKLKAGRPFDGIAEYKPSASEIQESRMDMAVTDPDFKYPQLWKTNIAVDYKFGNGWIATAEVLYNKDVNAIYHSNIGLVDPTIFVNEGGGANKRYYFNPDNKRDAHFISDKTENVILMANTSKGQSIYGTFQLQRNFNSGLFKGLYLNGSFTMGRAKGVTDGSSSVASSAWKYRPSVNPNDEELGYSLGSFDSRLLLQAAYTANWGRNAATSVGLVYQMYQPFRFSYTYFGDVNGDGQNMNDLIYIPKNSSDIKIVREKDRNGNWVDDRDEATIWRQIDEFISQDDYLSKNRGEFAERNGAATKFTHQLDGNISHDIKMHISDRIHTVRFSFDIFNVLNLLNKDWGVKETTVLGGSSSPQYQFLKMVEAPSKANNYTPGYTMPLLNGKPITETYKDWNSSLSRWQIMFGIKYFF